MITREFNLYLHAGHSIPLVINVNQYDHGEQWLFSLFNSDGTQYVPSSGAIVGIKSDNLGIINSGSVDAQGRVVINETQQMTAAVGKAVFELLIDDQSHGTANFVVLVEPKPGDNADLSETDISMIEQAIEAASTIKPYGSPLVASTVAGMTDHEKVYVYVGSETGYTSGNWYYWDGSAWASGGVYNSVAVQTDTTLTLSGVAADAKKTGDEITDLKSQIEQSGTGVSDDLKTALLQLAQKVAYIDGNGQTYYDDLYDALYPPIVVTNITLNTNSLSFATLNSTQQLTAITTPTGGAVTWSSSNTSVATVSATGLVTAIGYGSATITATSGNVSATCAVTIAQATVTSISAVYTQSGTVYNTDSLESLKSDLVVTATWSNQTTSTVASSDYTLSGTLTVGASTITVSYGGKNTTFSVTVTEDEPFIYGLANVSTSITGSYITDTGTIESATTDSGYYEEYVDVHQLSSFLTHIANASKQSGKYNWRISIYDANKNFTRQLHPMTSSPYETVTLNSGEKYVRFGWYSTTVPNFYIESTSPESLVMEVGDINGTTGENSSSTVRARSTGYIPASASITVEDCPWDTWNTWAGGNGGGYFFRCYDESHNIVGTLIGEKNAMYRNDISQFSLPSGTAYVRMVLQKTGSSTTISSGFTNDTHPFAINGTSYQVTEA